MEWTDIRLTVAKSDADNAEAVATMIAEGGIYIEDYKMCIRDSCTPHAYSFLSLTQEQLSL